MPPRTRQVTLFAAFGAGAHSFNDTTRWATRLQKRKRLRPIRCRLCQSGMTPTPDIESDNQSPQPKETRRREDNTVRLLASVNSPHHLDQLDRRTPRRCAQTSSAPIPGRSSNVACNLVRLAPEKLSISTEVFRRTCSASKSHHRVIAEFPTPNPRHRRPSERPVTRPTARMPAAMAEAESSTTSISKIPSSIVSKNLPAAEIFGETQARTLVSHRLHGQLIAK